MMHGRHCEPTGGPKGGWSSEPGKEFEGLGSKAGHIFSAIPST